MHSIGRVEAGKQHGERCEILGSQNLMLLDDHPVGSGLPGSQSDTGAGRAQLGELNPPILLPNPEVPLRFAPPPLQL